MAATGACLFPSALFRREPPLPGGKPNSQRISITTPRLAMSMDRVPVATAEVKREEGSGAVEKEKKEKEKQLRNGWKEYLEQSKELIRPDSGPPRWFSPLECASRLDNSPLLLFLPGIDGVGLGLIFHQNLGRIFDIWCLHIPVANRTPFIELVKIVERTIRSEYQHSPNKPIYLVGESLGACLALAVAALNPDIDLVIILVNPATSFNKSNLQHVTPLLEVFPEPLSPSLPNILKSTTGESLRKVLNNVVQELPLQNTAGELVKDFITFSLSLPVMVLADILPKETLLWKLKILKSASAYANSRLSAVKAQTLILCSGNDQLLPSQQEGERLLKLLPISKCQLRKFDDSGHFLFLEGNIDLVTIIKSTSYYRRGKYHDYASDFIPPTLDEAKKVLESYRLYNLVATVMLSTLEDGIIVKGLAGIPSEGPVLFVGNHMLLGLEKVPLIFQFLLERNIVVRGIAHPLMFRRSKKGKLPDISYFDSHRIMGIVPVAPTNLFKLFSSKSHVLLYPGGIREAFHRKGEEYKLFWPEEPEFVRMAARFGAKIVPFGAVGEDDLGKVVFDYDDLVKIPYFRSEIESLTSEATQLRRDAGGEVANQPIHMPLILPKVPGRLYYYFGKPLETKGREQELRDKKKSQEFYLQVKSEVERCITYLKVKRESDPYRGMGPRVLYQAIHGFESEVPTFEI